MFCVIFHGSKTNLANHFCASFTVRGSSFIVYLYCTFLTKVVSHLLHVLLFSLCEFPLHYLCVVLSCAVPQLVYTDVTTAFPRVGLPVRSFTAWVIASVRIVKMEVGGRDF